MKKIAVFASGNGSNFQVIAEQFPVEFVFSDHRDAYVLERADKLGVLSYAFELKEFESKADYEAALVELLEEYQIDLVCLAGYMKIVGPTLLAAYEGRIINIHPAYLPEFPGAHGIEDAWNAGVAESGVTIHKPLCDGKPWLPNADAFRNLFLHLMPIRQEPQRSQLDLPQPLR